MKKKSFRLLLALLLIGGFALSFSSCKDSENVSNDPNSPENIALSKETKSAKALLSILSFTSELDSLPDNWASNSFTVEPTVGIVNDASTPYVRYIPVINKEEAITKYNSFAGKEIDKNAKKTSWNIENVGSMTFNVLDQADVTATLDINIKQQPHLTQIRFVPASALGSNASVKETPFYSFGDIVALTEGKNTSYWVCVRPCSKLDNKETSHWLSFQLNDWDDNEKNGVKSGDLNIKKLKKTGYEDYYLPTKLGNKSGAREHIPNLFRLLEVLDNPTVFSTLHFNSTGLGSNNPLELTQSMVESISSFWDDKNYWKLILPKEVQRADITNAFQQGEDIHVFYNGYTSSPSVFIARLLGETCDVATGNDDEKDEIKWERTKQGVDFHDYATYGMQRVNTKTNVSVLPQRGYIVRYKTGAQLVGSWGNDDDYKNSFTKEHPKTIKDIYVYNNVKSTEGIGASVMGDEIRNKDGKTEYCVLNNSSDAPTEWSNYSYYFKLWEPTDMAEAVFLKNEQISVNAYMHLLNALMLRADVYQKYVNLMGEGNLPAFSTAYRQGLNSLYYQMINGGISTPEEMNQIVEFKATDKNGNRISTSNENELKKLEKFSLIFPYGVDNFPKGTYRTACLEYNLSTGKYQLTEKSTYEGIDKNSKKMYCLIGYKDIRSDTPVLTENQTFVKSNTLPNRKSTKQASIEFVKNHASDFK